MRGEVVQHYADLLRLRIVDVDQVAHALGKVECSALLGDLDLPPGPMRIEEDEKIRRAVALVLVVVSLALSRARRQGQPLLRNELSRALVETDHGTCWFRLLGTYRMFIHASLQGSAERITLCSSCRSDLLPTSPSYRANTWRSFTPIPRSTAAPLPRPTSSASSRFPRPASIAWWSNSSARASSAASQDAREASSCSYPLSHFPPCGDPFRQSIRTSVGRY